MTYPKDNVTSSLPVECSHTSKTNRSNESEWSRKKLLKEANERIETGFHRLGDVASCKLYLMENLLFWVDVPSVKGPLSSLD
jgi:hypothetical protein